MERTQSRGNVWTRIEQEKKKEENDSKIGYRSQRKETEAEQGKTTTLVHDSLCVCILSEDDVTSS